ncbi:hypothetical protein [Streptobacillus moniliformis]|uniref:hypothetical protein n=1 Tax=Streptobacillus moniliformis TaxID=34105 RepID=UPI0007E390FA|nr:hypothetical protein [Streptobacillus moniliformis]
MEQKLNKNEELIITIGNCTAMLEYLKMKTLQRRTIDTDHEVNTQAIKRVRTTINEMLLQFEEY